MVSVYQSLKEGVPSVEKAPREKVDSLLAKTTRLFLGWGGAVISLGGNKANCTLARHVECNSIKQYGKFADGGVLKETESLANKMSLTIGLS